MNSKVYNVLSQKFHVWYYDEHNTMIFCGDNMSLTKNATITNSSVEFITTLFNDNTWETLYIIPIYKPPKMQVTIFNYILKNIIQKMPSHCPTVIIEDFKIYFLTLII